MSQENVEVVRAPTEAFEAHPHPSVDALSIDADYPDRQVTARYSAGLRIRD
jgi:hypothetical protein